MIAFTVPFLALILMTSQYIAAYPSADKNTNYPLVSRLKREFAVLQRHDLANNYKDEIPLNFDENLSSPFVYSIIPRPNRKRLIDF